MKSKQEIRYEVKKLKAQFSQEEKAAESREILSLLEAHPRFVAASSVLLFHSLPDEVQTHAFIDKWAERGKNILLPVVVGEDLDVRQYEGKEELAVSDYNILEPQGRSFTKFDEIGLAVIPGVAFDDEGHRVGRGKGYYDRLLASLSDFHLYKLGICFSFQKFESLPYEPFDIVMDEVL